MAMIAFTANLREVLGGQDIRDRSDTVQLFLVLTIYGICKLSNWEIFPVLKH
jgi:hypothetical protein